jgi:hypothetical protein
MLRPYPITMSGRAMNGMNDPVTIDIRTTIRLTGVINLAGAQPMRAIVE